jgi:hypothetical protein
MRVKKERAFPLPNLAMIRPYEIRGFAIIQNIA